MKTVELYNLKNDQEERINIDESNPLLTRELLSKIENWRKVVGTFIALTPRGLGKLPQLKRNNNLLIMNKFWLLAFSLGITSLLFFQNERPIIIVIMADNKGFLILTFSAVRFLHLISIASRPMECS